MNLNAAQFTKNKGRTIDHEDDLVWVHHVLMKEYGWIPLDEFDGSQTEIEYEVPVYSFMPWYKPWSWGIVKVKCKAKVNKHKPTLPTIWNLLDCIREDKENEQREMDKAKHKKQRLQWYGHNQERQKS